MFFYFSKFDYKGNRVKTLQIDNSNFEFISNIQLSISNENCSTIANGKLFSKFSNLVIKSNVLFNERICIFIFENVNLDSLTIYGLNNTNRFSFLNLQPNDGMV